MCCHLITTKAMCLRGFIPLYCEALNMVLRQRHCSAIKPGKSAIIKSLMHTITKLATLTEMKMISVPHPKLRLRILRPNLCC